MNKIKLMFMICILFFAGCSDKPKTKEYELKEEEHIRVRMIDGHRFILYNHLNQGGICHHPDCAKCINRDNK